MSYKSVNPNQKDFIKPRKWTEWKQGDYIIGKKIECKETDKYRKPIYAVVVEESNFGAEIGKPIYLNCGGNFRAMIDMVEDDENCRIEYRGMNIIKKGEWKGEKTHDIDVQIPSTDAVSDDDSGL
jgi:hypothetical protein